MYKQPKAPKFEIDEVEGHPFRSSDLRVVLVGFAADEVKFLNLEEEELDDDVKKGINTAIQKWKADLPDKKRHHGWDATQSDGIYTECYVFKHSAKKVRIYGYLIHPQPQSRVVCCVLMHFATKNEDETDTKILNEIVRLGSDPEFKRQVEEFYKNYLSEKEKANESQKGKT